MHKITASVFHNNAILAEDIDMFRAIKFDASWHCHYNASAEEIRLFTLNRKYHVVFSDNKEGDMILNSIGSFSELNFCGITPLS